ncbi:hypothetical protein C8A00DRAFT_34209 [Chaetomidium leptoderma]|uniref:F-box domain-containing protein n=1 Tax=Chaetomidium leptoderma TaxID=669021 RepID=A0AAN6VKU3_9PEZI|nr:hypothetical protein C8A00DRAFT_34209 [Chaetomidium leptoderma]
MAPPPLSSNSFAAPNRMCWLCRRESDILRYNHSPNPRSALFWEITFPENAAGRERTATISAAITDLGSSLPHSTGKRTKPSSTTEKTRPKLDAVGCPVYSKATKTWAFRVHADCWDLVACQVSDPIACATAWCESLISVNWGFNALSPVIKTPKLPKVLTGTTTPHGRNHRRVTMQQLESFDGLAAELGLDHLPTVHKPVSLSHLGLYAPKNDGAPIWPSKANDLFSILPEEILQQIIEYTPTTDLVNLRLASRPITYASRLANLPRRFWRSRFTPPFEMGFASPERVDADLDWRGMYFLTRRALLRHCVVFPRTESPLLARLAKRRYWWERLRRIAEMDEDWGLTLGAYTRA